MDTTLETALADAALLLSDRRDGYAVIRREVPVEPEPGVTDLPLPLTRAPILSESVVGYCRLPTTAIEVAATLTTIATRTTPGVVFAAVHGSVADNIRVAAGDDLIPAHAN
jgi:hypothetical protein